MNDQLVSMITQLVMEKMEKSTGSQAPEIAATSTEQPLIKFYDKVENRSSGTTEATATSQEPLIQLYQHGAPQEVTTFASTTFNQPVNDAVPIKPFQFEEESLTESVQAAKKHTPARIGVGRGDKTENENLVKIPTRSCCCGRCCVWRSVRRSFTKA